jgi:glycosyltransferase involved in cell wall biosynthesis
MAPWLSSWNLGVHAVGAGRFKRFGLSTELDSWLADNMVNFDSIVVHGIWMYFSYAVWKATRKLGIPYFLFIHGALDPWFNRTYPLKRFKKLFYWKLIEHKVLRDAEKVLFTTQEEMMLANRAFLPWACKPEVTGYGITRPPLCEGFEQARCRQQLTEAYPQLRRRKFILFLARIHEKKGLDLLLEAFAASQSALSVTALMIAGAGDQKLISSLKSLTSSLAISKDVVWAGPLYDRAKWDVMRSAEVYVLPSHQENFGISVVEALACGLPVLISDKVNIWREVQATNAGLIAADDVAGVNRLLTEWAGMTVQQKSEMRDNAKSCFEKHFDISKTSERFFSILERNARSKSLVKAALGPSQPAAAGALEIKH